MVIDELKVYKPQIHKKTWGREEWITNNTKYCSKILAIEKDKHCSLHCHYNRDKHFFVLRGKIKFEFQGSGFRNHKTIERFGKIKTVTLYKGDVVEIKRNLIHRFTGIEDDNVLLEISTEHREDDDHRIEPSYQERDQYDEDEEL